MKGTDTFASKRRFLTLESTVFAHRLASTAPNPAAGYADHQFFISAHRSFTLVCNGYKGR